MTLIGLADPDLASGHPTIGAHTLRVVTGDRATTIPFGVNATVTAPAEGVELVTVGAAGAVGAGSATVAPKAL